MAWIAQHPAPGFGDLLPGWFVVPQNPVAQPGEAKRVQSMGEFLPAAFVVPQNPLINALQTVGRPPGTTGGGTVGLMGGLGEFNLSEFTGNIGDAFGGIGGMFGNITPTQWLMIGGGALLLVVLLSRPGRSQYRAAVAEAKDQYRAAVAKAKARYPRVGARLRRGYQAAAA